MSAGLSLVTLADRPDVVEGVLALSSPVRSRLSWVDDDEAVYVEPIVGVHHRRGGEGV